MTEQPLTSEEELQVKVMPHQGGPKTLVEFRLWTRYVYHALVRAMDLEAAGNCGMDYYAAINRVEKLGRLGLRFGAVDLQKRCDVGHLPKVSELIPVVVDYLDWCRGELALSAEEEKNAETSDGRLAGRFEKAYQSFKIAEGHLTCDGMPPTDPTAYEWLTRNGTPEYELPPYTTWARYVRCGRKFYKDRKNTPRAGRECPSAVDSDGMSLKS